MTACTKLGLLWDLPPLQADPWRGNGRADGRAVWKKVLA
jgi:hypothetical protein